MTAAAEAAAAPAVQHPSGADIIRRIKQAGIKFVVSVPDIVTSEGLLRPLAGDPDLKLVRVCKEDEGVSVCAAMSYSGVRALLLMQQTGLMDSLNAVRALAMDYGRPICMMVGLQGKEPHLPSRDSAAYGVRVIEPVLDAMGVPHSAIEAPGDVEIIAPAVENAYAKSVPHCFLIGRPPEP